MTNEFVPKSSLSMSSPILDRFRLLLKEREDQFTFSGEDPALTTEEFVGIYEDLLSELTINSKPIITDLTIIAGDFKEHAEGICLAVCSRVLEVSVEQKMATLYLLDSIVKNIGWDYIRYFAPHLPQVFCEVYKQVPQSLHSSMRRLFATWSTVFPESVLRQIEDELQLSPSVNEPSSSLGTMRDSESSQASYGIHVNPDLLKSTSKWSPMESSSHYGRSRVRGRDAETDVWQKRHRSDDFNSGLKNETAFHLNNGFEDNDGSRALINAFGRDYSPVMNSTTTKIAENSWRNTEEEEFDWEDMSPTLANRKPSNFTQSSIPLTTGFRGVAANSLMSSRPFSEQMLKTVDSLKVSEDVNQIQDGALNMPVILAAQLNVNGGPQDGTHFQGVLPGVQPPTSLHSAMPLPPLYPLQKQSRPPFESINSGITILNQGHRQFENDLPKIPHPRFSHLHHQPRPPVSFPQQLPQLQYNAIPSITPVLPRPPDLRYLQQSQMAAVPSGNNPTHVFHAPPSYQPSPINISGLLNSGLLNSLVSQGLLPLTKQSFEQIRTCSLHLKLSKI